MNKLDGVGDVVGAGALAGVMGLSMAIGGALAFKLGIPSPFLIGGSGGLAALATSAFTAFKFHELSRKHEMEKRIANAEAKKFAEKNPTPSEEIARIFSLLHELSRNPASFNRVYFTERAQRLEDLLKSEGKNALGAGYAQELNEIKSNLMKQGLESKTLEILERIRGMGKPSDLSVPNMPHVAMATAFVANLDPLRAIENPASVQVAQRPNIAEELRRKQEEKDNGMVAMYPPSPTAP